MWYSFLMARRITDRDLKAGIAAVENAQNVRQFHRRRTARGDNRREADIRLALERIASAMKPIRSFICGFAYAPQSQTLTDLYDEACDVSRQLQGERRRLWKMQKR